MDTVRVGPDTDCNAYTVPEGLLQQTRVLLQCTASKVGYQEPVTSKHNQNIDGFRLLS